MKKILAIALVLVMILTLCACGSNPYAKYEYINKMLDEGDYEGAIYAIMELYQANQPTPDPNVPTTTEPPKPTEEERQALRTYINDVNALMNYLEDGYINIYRNEVDYRDNAALAYIYKELQELSIIDKWVGTEYTTTDNYFGSDALEINWNRQEVLDAFQIVKDVALTIDCTDTDNMGNVSEHDNITEWNYDAAGVLLELYGESHTKPFFYRGYNNICYYTYDDEGNVTQIKGGYGDTVEMLISYTYENGKIVNEHIKTNRREWDVAYSYDDAGRLVRLDWVNENGAPEYVIYTYDDAGRLLSEEINYFYNYNGSLGVQKQSAYRMEYTYDASGNLVSGTYVYEDWGWTNSGSGVSTYIGSESRDQYTYTCDNQGRVTGYTVTYGDRIDTYGNGEGEIVETARTQNTVCEIHYGDYYIYAPAN